jgi:hypothetical protein
MEHGWGRCALKKEQRQVPEALGSRASLEGRNRAVAKEDILVGVNKQVRGQGVLLEHVLHKNKLTLKLEVDYLLSRGVHKERRPTREVN